jgi:hypothetical protein
MIENKERFLEQAVNAHWTVRRRGSHIIHTRDLEMKMKSALRTGLALLPRNISGTVISVRG